jgi:glycosyltransferase involved in cell wall biosynthesis
MRENSLISVIVPIYKVQDYLDECIESIINQTYSNIEVILVDDGSPDRCPQMCDEWAKRDSRIRVIHKKNGGLSSARNAGLDVAKGEYISFVDSDDFICKDALENLYNRIKDDKSIGITSGLIYRYQDGSINNFKDQWLCSKEIVIPSSEFLLETMSQKTSYTVWNKLYRRDVIGNTRFREGRNNEDTLFMYDLGKNIAILNVSMVEIPYYVYYYRYREDSICTTAKIPLAIDILGNYELMMGDCKNTNSRLYDVLYFSYVRTLYHFVDSLLLNPVWYPLYFSEYQKKLRLVPFEYVKRKFQLKDALYIQFLKYSPHIRKIIRRIKER